MEVVLIIAAAGGLLGCLGAVVRVDVSRSRYPAGRPVGRCAVR